MRQNVPSLHTNNDELMTVFVFTDPNERKKNIKIQKHNWRRTKK